MFALEPGRYEMPLDDDYLDEIAAAFGQVVDAKSPYTAGHSVRVALYTDLVAEEVGIDPARRRWLRRGALLHDVGKLGVSNMVLDKPGKLDDSEWEAVKRHAAYTESILARIAHFEELARVAGAHHERLDGSGYRGMSAALLPTSARILAAADTYATKLEPRPHRPAMTEAHAAEHLQRQADVGLLDPAAVESILRASGQQTKQTVSTVGDLTERETAVLRLLVQGYSNREIGAQLFLSPRTVDHHVAAILGKLGVPTRAEAARAAVDRGILQARQSPTPN